MRYFFFNSVLCGLRARSLQTVAILGVLLVGVALLSASFSPRQPRTVALDVGFSGMYFTLVLFTLFLIQELLAKEIDRRTVFFSLSYPVPRGDYLWGRYLGIVALLFIAAVILGLLLSIAVLAAGPGYDQQYEISLGWPFWVAILGLWVNVSVIAAFCLLISVLSTVSMLPMALGFSFALASRSLGMVLDYLATGADGDKALVAAYLPILSAIQWVLPDLSRLDWRAWPMYSTPLPFNGMYLSVGMASGYILLMLLVANRVFSKREFV